VLHSFAGGSDGAHPEAGLLAGKHGVLYGTTFAGGGSSNCIVLFTGCGTVFKLTPPATTGGAWIETVIHGFSGADGAGPAAGLFGEERGPFFGTTSEGGAAGFGTVFEITVP
jgi:uncharacterized repeat protein (TIGR03803 family)